jgi:hypothetical protein
VGWRAALGLVGGAACKPWVIPLRFAGPRVAGSSPGGGGSFWAALLDPWDAFTGCEVTPAFSLRFSWGLTWVRIGLPLGAVTEPALGIAAIGVAVGAPRVERGWGWGWGWVGGGGGGAGLFSAGVSGLSRCSTWVCMSGARKHQQQMDDKHSGQHERSFPQLWHAWLTRPAPLAQQRRRTRTASVADVLGSTLLN